MTWTAYIMLCGALGVRASNRDRIALATIAAGLVAVWAIKPLMHERAYFLAVAIIWLAISFAMYSRLGRKYKETALLLVASAVLKLPGRLWGAYELGNPYLRLSDIMGVLAVLYIRRDIMDSFYCRISSMVRRNRVGGFGAIFHRAGDPR